MPGCDEWEAFGLNSWIPCPNLHIMLESVDTGEFVCEMCDGPWLEEGKLGEAEETADYEETIVF